MCVKSMLTASLWPTGALCLAVKGYTCLDQAQKRSQDALLVLMVGCVPQAQVEHQLPSHLHTHMRAEMLCAASRAADRAHALSNQLGAACAAVMSLHAVHPAPVQTHLLRQGKRASHSLLQLPHSIQEDVRALPCAFRRCQVLGG